MTIDTSRASPGNFLGGIRGVMRIQRGYIYGKSENNVEGTLRLTNFPPGGCVQVLNLGRFQSLFRKSENRIIYLIAAQGSPLHARQHRGFRTTGRLLSWQCGPGREAGLRQDASRVSE